MGTVFSIEEAGMELHLLILLLAPLTYAEYSEVSSNSRTETLKPEIDLDIEGRSMNDPGMDATSKACRYDDGPGWSDCDPFELSRFRVLRLIHGGSQCEEVKNITKHCTPHEFPYGTHWLIDFFGTDNPFADFQVPNNEKGTFGGKTQDPPIERELYVSLEELYLGCDKKMKISRHVMNEDGHTSSVRDKILSIRVRRGWKSGTRITFKEEGDQGPNSIPADIIYILREKEHDLFKRDQDDLIYNAKIPLGKALVGCFVELPTLDRRLLSVPINDIVHPNYTKIVKGEGMPKSDGSGFGDLRIEFDVVFPERLTPEQKTLIKNALL